MAAATLNLNRDNILILRFDGEDLLDFISGSEFETHLVSMISEIELSDRSLRDHIIRALSKLTVDHGMPPSTDSWVMSNIVEPSLQFCADHDHEQPFSKQKFLEEFKKAAQAMAGLLREQPVIVAHCENTFDGSAIHKLLCDKFELDKSLDAAMATIPKGQNGKIPLESMRAALDALAISAGLPPCDVINTSVVDETLKMMNNNTDDEKSFDEKDFKMMMSELLEGMMVKLQSDPIVISSNTVVHESFAFSSSANLPPSSMGY